MSGVYFVCTSCVLICVKSYRVVERVRLCEFKGFKCEVICNLQSNYFTGYNQTCPTVYVSVNIRSKKVTYYIHFIL